MGMVFQKPIQFMLTNGSLDALTFTSGSTAASFFASDAGRAREGVLSLHRLDRPLDERDEPPAWRAVTIEARESTAARLRDALVALFGR